MICSVSLSPVMNMIGTCASALFCLSRRQVSNPSMPGITASIRMTSGRTFSTIESACSPSRATSTVMPASSSASVSIRSVSGKSSTTRTMSRASLRMGATNFIERRHISLELESVHDRAYAGNKLTALWRAAFDLVQFLDDPADMPDLAEPDQLVEVTAGRRHRRGRCRRPRRRCLWSRQIHSISSSAWIFLSSWRKSIGFINVSS